MKYVQTPFSSGKLINSFVPQTTEQILSYLGKVYWQIEDRKGISADLAMEEIEKQHGFI
ncbi:MAG: hypothetical protein LUE24_12620 [Lachnospiraceae bacterium]|nr:hypothetical protein [Lachnospiraceae bacterium]